MLALFYTLILLSVERHGYRTDEALNRGYQPFRPADALMGSSGVRTKLYSSMLDA